MTIATAMIRQQAPLENPFGVPDVRSRSGPRYSEENLAYSHSPRLAAQPQSVTVGFDPSASFYWQPLRPAENPLSPALMFAQVLHSLVVSGESRLSRKLGQRLMELSALEPGWDGENARVPRPEVLARTVSLILMFQAALPEFAEPFVVPTIGGFMQLEWHGGPRALEFEATADGWAIVGRETNSRGETLYHEADTPRFAVEKLRDAYRWFAGVEFLWPII